MCVCWNNNLAQGFTHWIKSIEFSQHTLLTHPLTIISRHTFLLSLEQLLSRIRNKQNHPQKHRIPTIRAWLHVFWAIERQDPLLGERHDTTQGISLLSRPFSVVAIRHHYAKKEGKFNNGTHTERDRTLIALHGKAPRAPHQDPQLICTITNSRILT